MESVDRGDDWRKKRKVSDDNNNYLNLPTPTRSGPYILSAVRGGEVEFQM